MNGTRTRAEDAVSGVIAAEASAIVAGSIVVE
jgi:hypothetical protein